MPNPKRRKKLLVFLSHASEDKPVVRELCHRLRNDGFSPWLDEEQLLPGQNWHSEIEQAMRNCGAVLLCFSEKSVSKEGYVQREHKKAMELQQEKPEGTIYVIPVRLDRCDIPPSLRKLQCVDFPTGYEKLVSSLDKRAGIYSSNREKKVSGRAKLASAGSIDHYPREMERELFHEQEGRKAMPENVVRIGRDANDANVILGNENTVVQIINHVYNKDDLMELVRLSFPELTQLLECWTQTFRAVDPKLRLREGSAQVQFAYEELVDDFIRNNEVGRLLGEIKKRNLMPYRNFLASQALGGIGLSPKEIPAIKTDTKTVEAELRSLQQSVAGYRKEVSDDSLEFQDRDELFEKIRFEKANHIVLHGPSGVGKTYFLEHLQKRYSQDTRCTFIDLDTCEADDILQTVVLQLGGEIKKDIYQQLAITLIKHLKASPPIHRFFFIFDNADQNQAAIDYLFSPANLVDNEKLLHFLKGWKLLDSIQLKIVIAARHPLIPSAIYPAFSHAVQIKFNPLKREYVQKMLEKIVEKRGLPIDLSLMQELSDEVYYLAGGHPKCTKQMLLALAEKGYVISSAEEWQGLSKEHVIATIQAEMLQSIDFELLPAIWNLSVFRRFDQRLLGGLLDRGILTSLPGDKSRRARELRAKLEKLNVFDIELPTHIISPNYAMRHALTLSMQLTSPDRYHMLNSLALELYLDRIQGSEGGAEQQVDRLAINLFELLYHSTKLLEIEASKNDPALQGKSICTRIRDAFENSLLLSLTIIQDENQPAFFHILKAKWHQDAELKEAVQRVTASEECWQELRLLLEKYDRSHDEAD